MIKSEVLHTIQCDRCRGELETGEYQYWCNIDSAIEEAENSEWLIKGDKHYCPNCYFVNDNGEDEIKPPFPHQLFKLKKFLTLAVSNGSYNEILDKEDLFGLSCYLPGATVSEAIIQMIKEIAAPSEIVVHIVPLERSSNNKLVIEIMKEVKK